jgi:hypothetical protein
MSASPSSASRLGTKLEIHHGVALFQSILGVACAQVAIFNGGFYATEVRLRRFGRLGRFPEKSRFLW